MKEGGATILGAGGSARAVAYALALSGVPVRIFARRPEQVEALVNTLNSHFSLTSDFRSLTSDLRPPTSDLRPPTSVFIINCTPVGMSPHINASPWPDELPFHSGQFLYDLVYNPPETKLMRQARTGGAGASNGLGMLLHQGALAWEQWTGIPAPLAAMRRGLGDS